VLKISSFIANQTFRSPLLENIPYPHQAAQNGPVNQKPMVARRLRRGNLTTKQFSTRF
jgi:hypothetical protein